MRYARSRTVDTLQATSPFLNSKRDRAAHSSIEYMGIEEENEDELDSASPEGQVGQTPNGAVES